MYVLDNQYPNSKVEVFSLRFYYIWYFPNSIKLKFYTNIVVIYTAIGFP